jgi:hypothetical protein
MLGFSYEGPRALLYRCVCVTSVASATLLVAIPILDRLTPNDLSVGLLLQSIKYFALGLGTLGSLAFLLLVFFRDVAISIKLRAFAAVVLPYVAIVIVWLIVISAQSRR